MQREATRRHMGNRAVREERKQPKTELEETALKCDGPPILTLTCYETLEAYLLVDPDRA